MREVRIYQGDIIISHFCESATGGRKLSGVTVVMPDNTYTL